MQKRSDYAERVGDEVRAELARQRMSQLTLASRMALSQPALSRRLNGDLSFTIADLDLIARILQVPMTKLLPDSDEAAAMQRAG